MTHLIRFRYRVRGNHTHVRVYAGKGTLSLGCCGELCFRHAEWETFRRNIESPIAGGSDIEFIPEPE